MDALQFLHNVQDFMGRDLSREEGDLVIEMAEEGGRDVQHVADLIMGSEDHKRIYG